MTILKDFENLALETKLLIGLALFISPIVWMLCRPLTEAEAAVELMEAEANKIEAQAEADAKSRLLDMAQFNSKEYAIYMVLKRINSGYATGQEKARLIDLIKVLNDIDSPPEIAVGE